MIRHIQNVSGEKKVSLVSLMKYKINNDGIWMEKC